MFRMPRLATSAAAGLALMLGAVPALAQTDAQIEAALASGAIGEQADGYIGFVRAPAPDLKAKVDAINIKRREGYTHLAQAKNVPIEAFAASIGCQSLSALRTGRAYSVTRGVWAVKTDAPIALPPHCGS